MADTINKQGLFGSNVPGLLDRGIASLYDRDTLVGLENEFGNQFEVENTATGLASDARHMAAMNELSKSLSPMNNPIGNFVGDTLAFGAGLVNEVPALGRGFSKQNLGEIAEDIAANFRGSFGTPNYGVFATSTDGNTFTIVNHDMPTSGSHRALAYGNSTYVVGYESSGALYSSSNLTSWTSRTTNISSGIYASAYLNNTWFIGGYGGEIAKTSDITTAFTVDRTGALPKITFSSAPADQATILIYLDEWYNLNPVIMADQYLANDIPISDHTIFTLPIHQKTDNFTLRLFTDSPFPVSLNSMMWEGIYSPRFYRRT